MKIWRKFETTNGSMTNVRSRCGSGAFAVGIVICSMILHPGNLEAQNTVKSGVKLSAIPDQTTSEDHPIKGIALTISVGAANTGNRDNLLITAASSNPALVPDNLIIVNRSSFIGDSEHVTIDITPARDQNGTTSITVTVNDGKEVATVTFMLTVSAYNDPPTISGMTDQTTNEDTPITGLAFTVDEGGGSDEDEQVLKITVRSSNTNLFPTENIVVGFADDNGDAGGGTLELRPAPNQNGKATITLSVTDGENTSESAFVVTVQAVNDAPTMSDIPDQTIDEDSSTADISFVVDEGGGDDENQQILLLSATSSNTTLIPDTNIRVAFSDDANDASGGTMSIYPAPDQNGRATISVTLNDGVNIVHETFEVIVEAIDDAPLVSALSNQFTNEDTPITGISFTADEGGGADEDRQILAVTVTSPDKILIPESHIVVNFVDDTADAKGGSIDIRPAKNMSGSATLLVDVSDGVNHTQETFVLTINTVNDPPELGKIGDQTTAEDIAITGIAFTADEGGGEEEDVQVLRIRAASSNTTLVPDENITIHFVDDTTDCRGGTLDILPAPNQNGTTTITIIADDRISSVQQTFILTVSSENDPPVITDIPDQQTLEDKALPGLYFDVDEGGSSDEDSQVLTVSATSSNQALLADSDIVIDFADDATDAVGGTISVRPADNQSGETTVTVTVSDGVNTVHDTFVLTVLPVNDPPVIADIPDQTTNEDEAVTGILLAVDEGGGKPEDSQILVVTASSSNTTLVPNRNIVINFSDDTNAAKNGTIDINPAPDQNGSTIITLRADDGTTISQKSFRLAVTEINDAPTLSNISDQTTAEDIKISGISFTTDEGGGSDEDRQIVAISAESSNPGLIPDENINIHFSDSTTDATGGTLDILPLPDKNGTSTITVVANDGLSQTRDSFILTVSPVNDPPRISRLADQSMIEDSIMTGIVFDIEPGGGNDEANQELEIKVLSSNSTLIPNRNITLSVIDDGSIKRAVLEVKAEANENGQSTITISVSDGLSTVYETFVITVESDNDPPTISAISDQTTNEDSPISGVAFTADEGGESDEDNQVLNVKAFSSNPELVPDENITVRFFDDSRDASGGSLKITPLAERFGTAIITVIADDGTNITEVSFVLTVNAIDDPPVISAVPDQRTAEDEELTGITFSVNEGGGSDEAGQVLTVSATSSNTTLIPNSGLIVHFMDSDDADKSGSIDIRPAPDQNGMATITVQVTDGFNTKTESFTLTVTTVNDPPVLSDIGDRTTTEDLPITGITFSVDEGGGSDEDEQILTVSATSSNPALIPDTSIKVNFSDSTSDAKDGVLVLTPVPNQNGESRITVRVNDGDNTIEKMFLVTVLPTNDRPTISPIPDQEIDEDTEVITVTFETDEGGGSDEDEQTLTLTVSSSDETLVPNDQIVVDFDDDHTDAHGGKISISPIKNQHGQTTITITVDDGELSSNTSFLLRVRSIDDAPIAYDEEINTEEDVAIRNGRLRAEDADGDMISFGIVANGSKGVAEVVDTTQGTYIYTPHADENGADRFTFKVNDGKSDSRIATVFVTINPVEDYPEITDIPDQKTDEDLPIKNIEFAVDEGGGTDEDHQVLTVSAESSNPELIPNNHIRINFSDGTSDASTGHIEIIPVTNMFGIVTITVFVDDGLYVSQDEFKVTVIPVNDPPTLSPIPDQSTGEEDQIIGISFTVDEGGGTDEDVQNLIITATSSNTKLVSDNNIRINFSDDESDAGAGTIDILTTPGEYGNTTITITVNDGSQTISRSFVLTKTYSAFRR